MNTTMVGRKRLPEEEAACAAAAAAEPAGGGAAGGGNRLQRYWRRLTWEESQLTVVFLLFVTFRAVDRVICKRVSDRMVNYQLMYSNIFYPVGVQVMQLGVSAGWVYWNRRQGDLRYDRSFFYPGAAIASAVGAFPQWRLALFSFWDQLNATLTSLPSPFIDLTSQSLLCNLVIVWTVLISIPYLRTRYETHHYVGCLLVVLSSLVAVCVNIQTGSPPLGEYRDATGRLRSSDPLWYALFIVGTVPAGISNCYKQKCLKSVDLEVMYATLWGGWWQILWGVIFFPFNWLGFPDISQQTADQMPTFAARTMTCFFGDVPAPSARFNRANDLACDAPGGSAASWFCLYLLFNVAFNVLFLWLTKRMSATWASIATVLCLDLTALLSMSKALMGEEATPVTFQQYLALVLAGVAMWVYNLKDEVDAEGNTVGSKVTLEALADASDRARWSQVHLPRDGGSFTGISESRGASFMEGVEETARQQQGSGVHQRRGHGTESGGLSEQLLGGAGAFASPIANTPAEGVT